MNITIVCDVLGEVNNGTTLATVNLIDFLQKKGHNITIVSTAPRSNGNENYYIVPALNLGRLLNKVVAKNGVTLAKADEATLEESMKDADVVHVQIPLLLGSAAVKVARKLGKPITASFHCQAENISAHIGLMNSKFFNHLVYKSFYRKVYKYCDKVHYPTEFIREVFEEETDKTNAVVISNGVNEAFFKPINVKKNTDKFLIVCSGRYSREKAQWQLIKAVSKSKYRDKIKIVLAGDGPYKSYLSALAKAYNVDCTQRFFSREDMIKLLHCADLYVHTAIIEIEAIACMEAIVCGLVPVICNSNRSATRHFAIDEKNLFEPKNIKDLTEKIDYWIENDDKKKERAAQYKESSRDFELASCMVRMEEMLYSAAKESGKNIGGK